jgi:hypothetical protein
MKSFCPPYVYARICLCVCVSPLTPESRNTGARGAEKKRLFLATAPKSCFLSSLHAVTLISYFPSCYKRFLYVNLLIFLI